MRNKFTKILLSIFMLLSLESFSQTEKETIDFLNSKLLVYTESFPGDEPAYFNVRKGFDSNSNKIILVDLFVNNKLLSTEKFHGRDINAVTTIKNGIGNLCIYLNSSEGLILNQFSGQENETFKNEIRFVLKAPENEVSRIKKALEHLLKLNDAKLANDSLFKN
jgi:hypothetical protein